MLIACALALLAQSKPGPLDGFRTNLASVRASVQFRCDYYTGDFSAFVGRLEDDDHASAGPGGKPGFVFEGTWEFDGAAEHYLLRIKQRNGPGSIMHEHDALCDPHTFASRNFPPAGVIPDIKVFTNAREFPFQLIGPFTWMADNRLDREIEVNFGSANPEGETGQRGRHPTEVEIYEKSIPGSQLRLRKEIWYDPMVGYIPRFYRSICYGIENGRSGASVREFYLLETQLCAGGFVPAEWYLHQYDIDDFSRLYPNYNHLTRLRPTTDPSLTHFKAVKVEEKKTPVRLEALEGIEIVSAPGGRFNLKGARQSLTLGELKSLLGKLLKPQPSNRPIAPNIDYAEMREFDRAPQRSSWLPYIIAGIVVACVLAGGVAWRRSRLMIILIVIVVLPACGYRPVAHLTAAFDPTRLLCDPARSIPPLSLIVHNAGNQTLRIFSVDAGCTCRHVDQTRLPATLGPDADLKLTFQMRGMPSAKPQGIVLTFRTDQGSLAATATLFACPTHILDPPSVTLTGLDEGPDGAGASLELAHREILAPNAQNAAVELVFPGEFRVETVGTKEGRVNGAPEFSYKQTNYKLTLKDCSFGLHRADIVLQESGRGAILDTPIVWERLPFLSSAPPRVILSSRACRAFLRCRDGSVELSRVVSAPKGVEAVVSSPREVTLRLADSAPGVINGSIEIATTASGRPLLKIPVVRYAPSADRR